MRIVVLDDVVLSKEHIRILTSAGELSVYQGTPITRDEILSRADGANIIISGWTQYPVGILEELANLRMISLWSTGTDCVDLIAAKRAGINVTNVPGFASNAVAELTFGLMLAVMRKIPSAMQGLRRSRANNWQQFEGCELAGKTLGILGTGAIGVKVARIAKGFDMNIIAYDVHQKNDLEINKLLKYVAFKDVFSESDIVTVHMPLITETKGIITYQELASMPPHAVFINTARAGIVDQGALTLCLNNGILAGAGLDDADLDHPTWEQLSGMDHVVMTPHIGFYTHEAVQVKSRICVDNVMNFIAHSFSHS